jgi:hypothetical protein
MEVLMKIYKIAQEDSIWDFPEAEHDYDPSWDYEVDINPDQKIVNFVDKIMKKINNVYMPKIGMGKAKVAYVKEDEDSVARYISGTSPYPVFVLNLENIKNVIEELISDWGGDAEKEIEIAIETTLYHELGHAIQDWMGLELEEDEAENFGIKLYETGTLDVFWE